MSQKLLLKIVQTWNLNPNPEYRGFRCANCQRYLRKAWYHWLKGAGYKTPVHFCNDCEEKFKLNKIKVNKPKIVVNKSRFKLPKETKNKLIELSGKWDTKTEAIYKMFTCDACNKDMYKAYHIWLTEKENLIEVHLCRECGDKLLLTGEIKGVIYDLDGTLISTQKLHENAWLHAGKKFDIPITKQMLLNQRGISNQESSLMMVPNNKRHLLKKFKEAKCKYVNSNIAKIKLFPGVSEILTSLVKKEYIVWICTSATKDFSKKVLKICPGLKKIIKDNIVWRELYRKEKPSPEALKLTIKKTGLENNQVCYIGDAFSDYKTSINAGVKFIYFCPNAKNKDLRIPKSIPVISTHKEIFKLLK